MANVVSKIMLKMRLVSNDKVVFVNNSLELLGSFVGQTPAKVDAKVAEACGGIMFIDEAYSIVKEGGTREGSSGSFGREAIDTLMKHLDPPSCIFIFAGYEKPMNDFLKVNEGLARRIPYRYQFEAYNLEQLLAIFKVMCESKGEALESNVVEEVEILLKEEIGSQLIENQNAGLISNWVSFAQVERDDRVDLEAAEKNPELASLLCACDFKASIEKLKSMAIQTDAQLASKIKDIKISREIE